MAMKIVEHARIEHCVEYLDWKNIIKANHREIKCED
jgi:hypothetical protein